MNKIFNDIGNKKNCIILRLYFIVKEYISIIINIINYYYNNITLK